MTINDDDWVVSTIKHLQELPDQLGIRINTVEELLVFFDGYARCRSDLKIGEYSTSDQKLLNKFGQWLRQTHADHVGSGYSWQTYMREACKNRQNETGDYALQLFDDFLNNE